MRIILIFITGFLLFSCGGEDHSGHSQTESNALVYTCPMHPEIIQNKPGSCPLCGMDLVPKKIKERQADTNLSPLLLPVNEAVIASVKTIQPQRDTLSSVTELSGILTYDDRLKQAISAQVAGRLEKLYARFRFQEVTKGQKLFEIYSPELQTAQQNYLFLLKNDAQSIELIKAAENKLLLLGMSRQELEKLKSGKTLLNSVCLFSPYSGHVHEATEAQAGPMTKAPATNNSELSIKEGMYFQKGETILQIYDISRLWVVFSSPPEHFSTLKAGQKLSMTAGNETIKAKISLVDPVNREATGFILLRGEVENAEGKLKPGMNVRAKLEGVAAEGLFVPAEAVLHLGERAAVFEKSDGMFRPKEIRTGIRRGNRIQVLSGLGDSSRIAANAQMLVDSESFIKLKK